MLVWLFCQVLCVSSGIVSELLTPFNEAVLTVNPWVGKCYYIHFTDRELKHVGTKWFVEVHTQHIAEQGLKITFQITGLELCLMCCTLLSLTQPSPCPLSTATCLSAPTPLHHVLHLVSFWAWGQLNHLSLLGLHRTLNVRRHVMHTSVPDTAACETLILLEGLWKEH